VAGQALVLFARAVDMPPKFVGLLLSFMPLSMFVVVFAVPLVEWLGPRRLLLSTWLARNILAMGIFVMPWAISSYGPAAGWHVLLVATFLFSLIRAVGVGGWYPWLHEIVPREQLGSYFSLETAMSQVINILIALAMAHVLAMGAGLDRFFWIYGAGLAAGLLSVLMIGRIPGGAGLPPRTVLQYDPRPALRQVWLDREYRHFLLLSVAGLGSLMWLNSAVIMYLRDILVFGETRIMLMVALGGVGVALTIRFWGRRADSFGSVPAMIQLLAGHSLLAVLWLCLLPDSRPTAWLVLPILVLTSLFNAAFTMVTARGMLCRVRENGRVGYTALWIFSVALANGIPPIMAGWLIDVLGLTGFRLCFLISALGGMVATAGMFRLSPEEGKPPVPAFHYLGHPTQTLRSFGRLFWFTLGFTKQ
jgi:hypothetical protein